MALQQVGKTVIDTLNNTVAPDFGFSNPVGIGLSGFETSQTGRSYNDRILLIVH